MTPRQIEQSIDPEPITLSPTDGVTFTVDREMAARLARQLRDAGVWPDREPHPETASEDHPAIEAEPLADDHPLWREHSGGEPHRDPREWGPGDLKLAAAFYLQVCGKSKRLLDLLIDHPGQRLTTTQVIYDLLPKNTFRTPHAIAGSLRGMRRARKLSLRRYPFYWWAGTPSTYAMKVSVAQLFDAARRQL